MSDKKNIDRLYQEKFKDFEPELPVELWSKIEDGLPKKKKRRVVAWWYYGGIAASIAILFSIFFNSMEEGTAAPQINDQVVVSETGKENKTLDDNDTIDVAPENIDSQKQANATLVDSHASNIETSPDQANQSQKTQKQSQKINEAFASSNNPQSSDPSQLKQQRSLNSKNKISPKKTAAKNAATSLVVNSGKESKKSSQQNATSKIAKTVNQGSTIAQTKISPEKDVAETITSSKYNKEDEFSKNANQLQDDVVAQMDSLPNKMVEDAIALQNNESDSLEIKSREMRRFKGSTLVAPVYSNSLAGSPLNQNVSDNSRNAGLNLSYGVALDYYINDRLSVRTGLHKIDMTYTTGDVRYMNTITTGDSPFSGSFNSANVTRATNDFPISQMQAPGLITNSFLGLSGDLSQQLGYLEVPLEMSYKLIASRWNLSVSGGMSALFLQENRVQLVGDNNRLELGSDDNFRNFNQSANFGIGLDYGLNDKLGIMIEPMFKYQFNALSNDPSGFSPYTIAVYSGLTYKF